MSTLLPGERVRLGADYLTEQHGPGWREKIDANKLDLFSARTCVLGQVYGAYDVGLDTLGISHATARVLGLNYHPADRGWGENAERVRRAAEAEAAEALELREAWVALLKDQP